MDASLVDRIQDVRFTTRRLRSSYAMRDVDDFLDQLVAAVRAGQPLDELVRGARFSPVTLQRGYDMAEVDAFLDEVVTASRER